MIKSKSLLIIFSSLILILFFPSKIFAQEILFNDDFETGNLYDKWSYISGDWDKQFFNNSTWVHVYSPLFKDNEIQAGNQLWTNYNFDLDIYKIQGEDINLFFRIQNSRYLNLPGHNLPVSYGLHIKHNRFALQKFTETSGVELVVATEGTAFLNMSLKHFTIKLSENNIKIFVGNSTTPVVDYTDINQPYLSGGIALASITGSASTEVRFDNVVVTKIDNPSPTPTTTNTPIPTPSISPSPTPTATPTVAPSPTPTITPTSTPIAGVLNVPSLKQYSLPWKNYVYGYTNNTIQELGCALTSVAMILQYHGHNIFPDALNDWLKSEPDGYIRNGLVNWLAISRYTKIHDSLNSPTLEYKRLVPNTQNLDFELASGRPVILKEVGHFIVGTGKLTNSYAINDPGYANRNSLLSYNNVFLALNAYRPTHSDLSYMMFVTDYDTTVTVNTLDGSNVITESYIDGRIRNLLNQSQYVGDPVRITLIEKPIDGSYEINVSGPKGNYKLESYLYDTLGKVYLDSYNGYLNGLDTDVFRINYSDKKMKVTGTNSRFKFWLKHYLKFLENHDEYK